MCCGSIAQSSISPKVGVEHCSTHETVSWFGDFVFEWDGWYRTVVDGRKCTCVMLAIVCFGVVFFPMHSCIRWSSCFGIRSFVRVEFSIDRSPRCLDASSADVDLSRPFFPPSFSSEGIPSILVSTSFSTQWGWVSQPGGVGVEAMDTSSISSPLPTLLPFDGIRAPLDLLPLGEKDKTRCDCYDT